MQTCEDSLVFGACLPIGIDHGVLRCLFILKFLHVSVANSPSHSAALRQAC